MDKMKIRCLSCKVAFWTYDEEWGAVASKEDLIPIKCPACEDRGHGEVEVTTHSQDEEEQEIAAA